MNRTTVEASRQFSSMASPAVRHELKQLTLQLSSPAYQKSLTKLGRELGVRVGARLGSGPTAVVTTPEDADFLTSGLVGALSKGRRLHLVCYWTTRFQDSATVNKEYVDPTMPKTVDEVVIAKSIISSGCIVRTNLEEFLGVRKPRRILIVAPVMLKGAEEALRAAFPRSVSKRFEFISFATDSHTDGSLVVPGVGGMVEARLGLRGKIAPALIKQWRQRIESVPV